MAIEVVLNGDNTSAIKELHDLDIIASVEKGNVNARITTDQLTFVNEYAQIIRDYINNGASGTSNGIFEGLPLQMFENGVNVFDGVVDLVNDFEITDPTTVRARIKKYESNNEVEDRMSGTTFRLLYDQGIITENDFIDIPYVVEKEFNFVEFGLIALSIYKMAETLGRLIKENLDLIIDGFAHGVVAPIWLVTRYLINATLAGLLISRLYDLVIQLFAYLISPIKHHKGIRVSKLLEKGFQSIGLTYNTTIEPILDTTLCILPSKNGVEKDAQEFNLINSIPIHQPGLGIPSAADYGYTLSEMITMLNGCFNAEYTVLNGVFEHHSANSPFWLQNSSWIMPDVLQETQMFNANELVSDKLITFKYDIKDSNTFENFLGTTYEIQTRPINTSDERNILMRGFEKIEIPYALGNRKEGLNNFEKFFRNFLIKVDQLSNALEILPDADNQIGDNPTFADKIDLRVGFLKLEADNVIVPKLLRLDSERKMFANDRTTWSAKYLYDLFHYEKSFVLDNYSNQYYLYKSVKVPFGFSDFSQLTQNSYFSNSNGELCKLEQIQWNVSRDFAIIYYRVKRPYTKNLEEIYIEQE